ncbi:MAG: undecaprenyl-diphosphatase [Actinomycetota bacterium]|nr:undecaprenyl-diphosphatase [Actinomycetota bacterium]
MPIYQALVLGITQGLTEFAPVSSSGHLILVPWLFHWTILNNPHLNKTFDVALHMGTFFGALIYFWNDVVTYIRALFRSIARRSVTTVEERLAWFIVIGTIPGALTGAALETVIEDKLGQPWLIAVMLVVFGILLFIVDKMVSDERELADLTLADTVMIGIAQAIALQPGVSRSGVTITAARARGMDREAAARFSFLLALPIIGGAGLLKTIETAKNGLPSGFAAPFFWGFVASGISGFLVIWAILGYVRRHDFTPFVIYRFAAAITVAIIIIAGVRNATL